MTLIYILLASLFVSAISFVGGLLLIGKQTTEKLAYSLVSFAAGVMLATAFIDLLPEALDGATGRELFVPALIGVASFFFLERFVLWFHHHDESHGPKPSVWLVLVGDAFHNVIDGIAIAATFLVSPALGITTTLAIMAHEIPQELADFSVLIAGGMSKTKALVYNFISGLTALLGAITAFFFLEKIQNIAWIFLSFTAGMFIYIACSDLIPELHKDHKTQGKWVQTLPFLAGIAILWVTVKLLEG